MAHDEFPPLTRSGIEVLQHANTANYENHPWPGGIRPFAAAVIREAVKQAAPFNLVNIVDMSIQQVIPSHQPEKRKDLLVVALQDLMDIADNLHALPSPPPTREQMNTALQELLADPYRGSEWLYDRLAILQRGLAHHCKVQP
jgi:hypothetical protein